MNEILVLHEGVTRQTYVAYGEELDIQRKEGVLIFLVHGTLEEYKQHQCQLHEDADHCHQ
jgi:hypothetical protein